MNTVVELLKLNSVNLGTSPKRQRTSSESKETPPATVSGVSSKNTSRRQTQTTYVYISVCTHTHYILNPYINIYYVYIYCTEYTMTGSSVAFILNKQSCAVIGSAAIDSRLQIPIPDKCWFYNNEIIKPTSLLWPLQHQAQIFCMIHLMGKQHQIPFPNLPKKRAPANA